MNDRQDLLRIGPVLRYGAGLATVPDGRTVGVPFTLPEELVEATPGRDAEWLLHKVIETSPARVLPGCPHFGVCGGCQLQMASPSEQLQIKQAVLLEWLHRAGTADLPELQVHAAEPWGYRNRIRLRIGRDESGALRFGYNERASHRFLPINTCPISAPLLWRAAEHTLSTASTSPELDGWLRAASEAEFFCTGDESRLQLTLLLEGAAPAWSEATFAHAMDVLQRALPELAGAGAARLGAPQRGRERTRAPLASWGTAGLAYTVGAERYWTTRGGFFQVNRFLLSRLVQLVCKDRHGASAWDLFAGVGLFARVLARTYTRVTAVEGNATAAQDLQAALAKLGKAHRAVQQSTLDFLQQAVLQRERPDLITLDPPRAGAGKAACELLLRLLVPEIVYVSCDPETLARDLEVLCRSYRVAQLHLIDMFPQTFHQETVVVLQREA